MYAAVEEQSQSLFYWITYSYLEVRGGSLQCLSVSILILLDYLFLSELSIQNIMDLGSLNPYFIGLPILIRKKENPYTEVNFCLNPYFIGLPILIVLHEGKDWEEIKECLNPYFIGLPILICRKNEY